MADKPRKRERTLTKSQVINLIEERLEKGLDGGTFGSPPDEAGAESLPSSAVPSTSRVAEPGRPPGSTSIDYEDMDLLIGFWHANPRGFSQKTLIDLIHHFYAHKERTVPAHSTIKTRIKRRKPKRK